LASTGQGENLGGNANGVTVYFKRALALEMGEPFCLKRPATRLVFLFGRGRRCDYPRDVEDVVPYRFERSQFANLPPKRCGILNTS